MNTIRIFLASSKELKPERLVIAELITKLNYLWDIDKGVFNYVENDEVDDTERAKSEDTPPWEEKKPVKKNAGTDYKDATEVF